MVEILENYTVQPWIDNGYDSEGVSNLPKGYEHLERIEVYQRKDKTEGLRGIIKLGAGEDVQEHSIILKQEAQDIWGFSVEDWQNYQKDPEKWEMKRQIAELTARVAELESKQASNDQAVEPANEATASQTGPNHNDATDGRPHSIKPMKTALHDRPLTELEALREDHAQLQGSHQAWEDHANDLAEENRVLKVSQEKRRRNRLVMFGAVAVAAVAGGVAGYLWGHHEGEENKNSSPQTTVNNNHTQEGGVLLTSQSLAGEMNGYRVDYFNEPGGNRLTGIAFTRATNLKLKEFPGGVYKVVEADNEKVVVMPHVGWDSQGKVDYTTRHEIKKLESKGYKISWGINGNHPQRKMTTIVKA